MNASLMILELAVIAVALGILLVDLWTPAARKVQLGYLAIAALFAILIGSFFIEAGPNRHAFGGSYTLDPLALFFKQFFIVAAIFVLLISISFADRIAVGISEFYSILLFALSGMMFAASANDFIMVFVSLELITVSFYILTSFQRSRLKSVEAGVKYLIVGGVASAFMVYGIALIFGMAQTTNFDAVFAAANKFYSKPLFIIGVVLVIAGLAFKIAAFPLQIWAPDVYQGSPAPVTAFLAVGSKSAGFVLLLRMLFSAVPEAVFDWSQVIIVIAALTILYGNLCAIPQRNLKRLLGYSSISNAGYLLLGVAAASAAGSSAVLYYLGGYLFTVIAAFTVISILTRQADDEDISIVAGLHRRSPLLAASLALAMISLAGIPPLAGFFGKFLLLKSIVERSASDSRFLVLIIITLFGVVTSFYYYLGVVRAIYWSKVVPDYSEIPLPLTARLSLYLCIAAILFLGIFPNSLVNMANAAVASLRF
ncbi:MAG: NADH-quinone oxidoreductase subunit N [Verrucomicrobiota bacterium]|nr:NADH-quinone oxidoreductase subunit N [Verrucomicrobiota bacterium]